MGGQGKMADQLTLSQPQGADYNPHVTICPPSFK